MFFIIGAFLLSVLVVNFHQNVAMPFLYNSRIKLVASQNSEFRMLKQLLSISLQPEVLQN